MIACLYVFILQQEVSPPVAATQEACINLIMVAPCQFECGILYVLIAA